MPSRNSMKKLYGPQAQVFKQRNAVAYAAAKSNATAKVAELETKVAELETKMVEACEMKDYAEGELEVEQAKVHSLQLELADSQADNNTLRTGCDDEKKNYPKNLPTMWVK
jgi:hypothetical protein